MSVRTNARPGENTPGPAKAIWIALVAALSVAGSLAFACAAPLAAISALAGAKMDRSSGFALVCLAWLSNQIVGFTLLGYPQTGNAFAWGAAICAASVAAFFAVKSAVAFLPSGPVRLIASFTAAFAAYELTLVLAGILLGPSVEAFSFQVIARVLTVNVISFIGLLTLHRLATAMVSDLAPAQSPAP